MDRPTERRREQPYRIVWRDDPKVGLGYQVYTELGGVTRRILAPLLNLADKSQWRRISDQAFTHEEDAWDWLEGYCAQHEDWHGVGYARAMYVAVMEPRERARREHPSGPIPRDPWLGQWQDEPSWVSELYH